MIDLQWTPLRETSIVEMHLRGFTIKLAATSLLKLIWVI